MNFSDWIGLGLGTALGSVYGWLQVRGLRRRATGGARGEMVVWPAVRLLSLMVILLLALRFTNANKYWLTGSLAVAYTAPLLWQLKQMSSRKK